MTATAHALAGAVIATKISNPIIGLPLAVLSHFVLDAIPHWDFGTHWRDKSKPRLIIESAVDVVIGFGLVFFFFSKLVAPLYLWPMVFAAQLPDWLEAPAWYFNVKLPPFSWAQKLQDAIHQRLDSPWGLVTQGVVAAAALVVLKTPQIGPFLARFF